MTITLHDFPNPSAQAFRPGDTVRGKVSFAASVEDTYAVLGCQLIITHTLHGRQEVEVVRSIVLARKVAFERGHERTYNVEFTIPDNLDYQGKLFSVRPGLRGYAVLKQPGQQRNVVLRRASTFYPTSEPWNYRLAAAKFRVSDKLNLLARHRGIDSGGEKSALIPLGLIATVFLINFGGWGVLAALFVWVALGAFVLTLEEKNESSVFTPSVRLVNSGSTLLVHLTFHKPPDDLTQITAGYEVREVYVVKTSEGESIHSEPASVTEPRQNIILNERGKGIAEHRYLPLPGPGMRGDVGFNWVYVVTAKSQGRTLRWEGVMLKEGAAAGAE